MGPGRDGKPIILVLSPLGGAMTCPGMKEPGSPGRGPGGEVAAPGPENDSLDGEYGGGPCGPERPDGFKSLEKSRAGSILCIDGSPETGEWLLGGEND